MATVHDPDSRVLRALRSAHGPDSMPTAALAALAGLTTSEISARIDALVAAGYQIASEGDRHRLIAAPATLIADDLCAGLPRNSWGVAREILVFAETNSTNDLAAQAGRDGVPDGLVIFAEAQRAGRGRLGREWTAPPHQALLFSVLLRPKVEPIDRWSELTFCAALAVAEVAEEFTGRPAHIKWPNDVLLSGRKISGILLERHGSGLKDAFIVAGIGVNVLQAEDAFPPELRGRAGSLAMFASPARALERRAVAVALLVRLGELIARWPDGFEEIWAGCLRRGCTVAKEELAREPMPGLR